MAEKMALDLQELRELATVAKRPRVLAVLCSAINNLEEELSKEVAVSAAPTPAEAPAPTPAEAPAPAPAEAVATGKEPAAPAVQYVTLNSFSWDQDNEKIKIYVFLEGVERDQVETVITKLSVDIKIHNVQGKNYRCAIPKLNKEIVPEVYKVLVKSTKVIITLYKASKGNWLDLHFKEDKLKLKPNLDKEKDPMAGIMNLMKNMYEEGDDEMKKIIAKSWTDARSGKTADPLGMNRR